MLIPGLELIRLTISRILQSRHPFSADQNHLHHLMNKKIKLEKTVFVNLSLIIIPVIINEITGQTISIIFFMTLIYFFIIFKLKKSKEV